MADLHQHVMRLLKSYKRWTGNDLLVPGSGASDLAKAPFVIVSHGVEADPILNYGNEKALELWEMTWEQFIKTPSRLTAEAMNREERALLLERVTRFGYIDDYSGVRISATGKKFRIEQATVWNILDEDGDYCGQAAMFKHWKAL